MLIYLRICIRGPDTHPQSIVIFMYVIALDYQGRLFTDGEVAWKAVAEEPAVVFKIRKRVAHRWNSIP